MKKHFLIFSLLGLIFTTLAFTFGKTETDPDPDPEIEVYVGYFVDDPNWLDDFCLDCTCPCFIIVYADASDKVVSGSTTTYHDAAIEKNTSSGTVTSSHEEIIVSQGSYTTPNSQSAHTKVNYVN